MYVTQQARINLDAFEQSILEFLCEQSNKLRNCAIYLLRQAYFTFGEVLDNPYDLHAELKSNPHYQILYSQAAQQVCTEVAESFTSFKELLPLWYTGDLSGKPKLPNYRKKGGRAGFTYPKQALLFDPESGLVRLPLGNTFKADSGVDALYIQLPYNIRFERLKELRILPRNKCIYAEFVYSRNVVVPKLDKSRALAIDHGINNWLTCVPNTGDNSFIIDGFKLKSLTQWYNKQVATIKEDKPQGFWNDRLACEFGGGSTPPPTRAQITEKRNRQVRDAANKAARFILNYCLKNNIGTVVFGWNQGNKDGIETGRVNNQKIVQTPTARLKKRICEVCKEYGIQFIETEESYSSQASFLDGDSLPKYGDQFGEEKNGAALNNTDNCYDSQINQKRLPHFSKPGLGERPKDWKPSGNRVTRGQYRTGHGVFVHADCNAAANIFRKVEAQLGLSLVKVCRGVLTLPTRVFLWNTKSKKHRGTALACLEATA